MEKSLLTKLPWHSLTMARYPLRRGMPLRGRADAGVLVCTETKFLRGRFIC